MLQSCPKRRIRVATRQCPCVTSLAMSKQDLFQQVKTEQVSSEKELEWIKKELQERTIRFGKTHCGKKFHTLAHSEPQYCTWFTFRWGESTKEEHREFLHFLNMYRAHGEVDGDSSPQRKTRAKAKASSKKHLAPLPDSGKPPSTDRRREPERVRIVRSSNGLSSICPNGSNGESHEPSRAEHARPHEQH